MGQYHYVVNIDKKQYVHPHRFDDGLKLLEFGSSGGGTMQAVAMLLAADSGRGGGDFGSEDPLVGSWAGDRIVIAGDYGDVGRFVPDQERNLHEIAADEYEDISERVRVLMDD